MKKLSLLLFAFSLLLGGCADNYQADGDQKNPPAVTGSVEEREVTPATNKADAISPAVIQSIETEEAEGE